MGGVSARQLLQAFESWRGRQQPLVLASVYATEGSTYSKPGAQMLINADGDFQGMLSGGCLEGDLAVRARQVLDSGEPQSVSYDLGQNDEELWGLGVGCDGVMRIFLQPLYPASAYQPFAAMGDALGGENTEAAVTVIEADTAAAAAGQSVVMSGGTVAYSSAPPDLTGSLLEAARLGVTGTQSYLKDLEYNAGRVRILVTLLEPPPRVLVLGAGLDAEPVVRLIDELGWRVTVQDHRPAYLENGDFSAAAQVLCVPAAEIGESLALDRFNAAIVMSHHLATDRQYLTLLASCNIPYLGLLGPGKRRDMLLRDLGSQGESLRDRLHGPAGLDLGGRGPAAIALSIVAQMHQQLVR